MSKKQLFFLLSIPLFYIVMMGYTYSHSKIRCLVKTERPLHTCEMQAGLDSGIWPFYYAFVLGKEIYDG